jgi:hypothetical protein
METRYKVCWYASIFIVNQKYVQMRFYLYFKNTVAFFITISMLLIRKCMQLENISFCIKKCFLFEFITKTSIQPPFQNFQLWYQAQTTFSSHFGLFKKVSFSIQIQIILQTVFLWKYVKRVSLSFYVIFK